MIAPLLTAILASPAAASPWDGTCEDRGREPWGLLVDVVDQLADERTEERLAHVRVHRPLEQQRLQRSVRASTPAQPGMQLCHGDWVESWHGAEVTLEERGARALLTLRGGSLVWLDDELRQVRGIVDYYVLDGARAGRDTPVPVALGYSATTASRQHSIFRVEILDAGRGEALVVVSPDSDVFSDPRTHGVDLGDGGDRVHVAGGQAVRTADGRVLSSTREDEERAVAALAEAKSRLDLMASELWEAPPTAGAAPAPRPVHVLLEGRSFPDELVIDGERIPQPSWHPARLPDGGRGLRSVGPLALPDGTHEVAVDTWGEHSERVVATDPTTRVVVVPRPEQPHGAGVRARRSLLHRYTRAERFEVRPSALLPGTVFIKAESDPRATVAFAGGFAAGRLPVRTYFHGGRVWLETGAVGGVAFARPSVVAGEEVQPSGSVGWGAAEAFLGLSGGNWLFWDFGGGVVTVSRFQVADRGPVPRQAFSPAMFAFTARLGIGRTWRVSIDWKNELAPCSLKAVVACPNYHRDMGVEVLRDLGRTSPFLRIGGRHQLTQRRLDLAGYQYEFSSIDMVGADIGIRWLPPVDAQRRQP